MDCQNRTRLTDQRRPSGDCQLPAAFGVFFTHRWRKATSRARDALACAGSRRAAPSERRGEQQ
eukprot:6551495-Prymnesium_polylepis.1